VIVAFDIIFAREGGIMLSMEVVIEVTEIERYSSEIRPFRRSTGRNESCKVLLYIETNS
jgi:hypothetical protein